MVIFSASTKLGHWSDPSSGDPTRVPLSFRTNCTTVGIYKYSWLNKFNSIKAEFKTDGTNKLSDLKPRLLHKPFFFFLIECRLGLMRGLDPTGSRKREERGVGSRREGGTNPLIDKMCVYMCEGVCARVRKFNTGFGWGFMWGSQPHCIVPRQGPKTPGFPQRKGSIPPQS